MRCPDCAEEIRVSAKVCGYCGTRLASPEAAVPDLKPEVVVPVDDVQPPESEAAADARLADSRRIAEDPEPVLTEAVGRSLGLLPWLLAAAVVVVGLVLVVILSGDDAESGDANETVTVPTTTRQTTTQPPAVTNAAPVSTSTVASAPTSTAAPASTVREVGGTPILDVEDLTFEVLNLLPPQLIGPELDDGYECEVIGTAEFADGPKDLIYCQGDAVVSFNEFHVVHGFGRSDDQTIEEALDGGDSFDFYVDGILQERTGYLEWNIAGDPVAASVFTSNLTGTHTLAGIWTEAGISLIQSVTEVVFP